MPNPVGRPPYYSTPEELQIKIDEYFKKCPDKREIVTHKGKKKKIPSLTITGLVLYLGFCDRQSFYAYEAKEKFSYTIKKARSFIEREYESLLKSGNCTGAIFALKNFGWKDKTEVEHSGNMVIRYGHRK